LPSGRLQPAVLGAGMAGRRDRPNARGSSHRRRPRNTAGFVSSRAAPGRSIPGLQIPPARSVGPRTPSPSRGPCSRPHDLSWAAIVLLADHRASGIVRIVDDLRRGASPQTLFQQPLSIDKVSAPPWRSRGRGKSAKGEGRSKFAEGIDGGFLPLPPWGEGAQLVCQF
jgi:hypothetical protein